MKILSVLLLALLPAMVAADVVVTADSVESYVNIRSAPDGTSEVVGRLGRGEALELVSTPEGWYEVRLDDESTGFVSADWSKVRDDEEASAAEAEEEVTAELAEDIDAEVADEVAGDIAAVVTEEVADEVAEADTEEVVEDVIEEVVEEDVEEDVVEAPDEVAETVTREVTVQVTEGVSEPVVADTAASPPGAATIRGDANFLVKFRKENEGGNSQVYDDGNKVGIGTTEPEQRLDVNGSVQIHDRNSNLAGLIITQSAGDSGYIMHNRAGTLTIGAGSQDRITIDRDGNVGIAVSKPEHPLEMASGAHVTAGGVWTNRSSRDSKENIALLSEADAAEALMLLEPVTFRYVNERDEDYVGFIAEDVPALVASSDRASLSTMDLVAVLTKVVQAQQRRIEELEARLDDR